MCQNGRLVIAPLPPPDVVERYGNDEVERPAGVFGAEAVVEQGGDVRCEPEGLFILELAQGFAHDAVVAGGGIGLALGAYTGRWFNSSA